MGGGGGLLSPITNTLFGSPQTVATPNYSQAAQQTAQGNLQNAQLATQANRVNQTTPFGTLNYNQTTDQFGNPVWSATQSLSPEMQNLFGSLNANAKNTYANGLNANIDMSQLPSYGIDPGQTYSDAIMQRLAPQLAHQSESSDVQLANMGIVPGTEAYNRAKTLLAQSQNDARTSAIVGGMNTGLAANNQAYNQQLNNANLAIQKYNLPLAQLSAFQSASNPGYVNPYTQSATPGADYTSAMGLTNQSQQANANAVNAQNNAMIGGLFSLAGGAIGSPKGTFSGMFGK
jgi:hypothetical protein